MKGSWIDGIYFSVVSLSTVGYGDIVLKSSRLVWLRRFYYAGLRLICLGHNICSMCLPLMARTQKMQQKGTSQYGSSLDRRELLELVSCGDKNKEFCTKSDFVLRMLLSLSIIEKAEIQMCERRFDILDVT